MLMRLIAAGTRMPGWVDAGVADYAGRLRGDYRLELVEIELGSAARATCSRAIEAEGERMLAAAGPRAALVALQVGGRALSHRAAGALARGARPASASRSPSASAVPTASRRQVDARACLRWSLSP